MRMFDSAIAVFKHWFMRLFYVMHFFLCHGVLQPITKSDLMSGSICLSKSEVQHKIDSALLAAASLFSYNRRDGLAKFLM